MLASLAIIGMLEVFAITTVRWASLPPVRGSLRLGQLGQQVGELVAALAAADVDDHVGIGPLRDLLQQHGLAGAEPAGHSAGTAPGHREEHVEYPLAGLQRAAAVQPLGVSAEAAVPARYWSAHRLTAHRGDHVAAPATGPAGRELADRAAGPRRDQHPVARPRPGRPPCPGTSPAVTTVAVTGLGAERTRPDRPAFRRCSTAVAARLACLAGSSQAPAPAAAAAGRPRPRRAAAARAWPTAARHARTRRRRGPGRRCTHRPARLRGPR